MAERGLGHVEGLHETFQRAKAVCNTVVGSSLWRELPGFLLQVLPRAADVRAKPADFVWEVCYSPGGGGAAGLRVDESGIRLPVRQTKVYCGERFMQLDKQKGAFLAAATARGFSCFEQLGLLGWPQNEHIADLFPKDLHRSR